MPVSRTEALNLSTAAFDVGADVLRGQLKRSGPDAGWTLGEVTLEEWLQRYEDHELVIIVAPIGPKSTEKRVCLTCGAEYVGSQCPHCRDIRQRLRERS